MADPSRAPLLFLACEDAIARGVPIRRESSRDKEFAAQDWIGDRLDESGLSYERSGRNTYPDFPLVGNPPEGFEVKSLAHPGRATTYDANSQPPSGHHHGRTVFYVFVRYPKAAGGSYPVHDLAICHGDFLNPISDYEHRNQNVPNWGGYGDIMIRDRKMYVVRTPYDIVDGLGGNRTLILPAEWPQPRGFQPVGKLERREADDFAVGYQFDLKVSRLTVVTESNPNADRAHAFVAYRVRGGAADLVALAATRARPRRRAT